MKNRLLLLLVALCFALQCGKSIPAGADHETHGDEAKVQWTAYSEQFELFAEADLLVAGKEGEVLAHFTHLADFKPLRSGRITLTLTVDGQVVSAQQAQPVRPGIYEFSLVPGKAGRGKLSLRIEGQQVSDTIHLDGVEVYPSEEAAHHALPAEPGGGLAVTFTKEKSWQVKFATRLPRQGEFGEVIKTVARVLPAQGDEAIVTAKANGVVRFHGEQVLEGKSLAAGQGLFSIAAGGVADNNSTVRFAEARNNFLRAKADYERANELARDRIVSEKELLKAKNEYDNAGAVFANLERNFGAGGQVVSSPISGFVKRVFVDNGQYVTTGQPVLIVAKNQRLLLRADVRQKHAPVLGSIVSATLRTLHDNRTYTLEQLNGRILSIGQSVNDDDFLIPVSLQIDHSGNLLPGGFVELCLKGRAGAATLSVPATAILEDQGSHYVFVQLHPESFVKREVRIGASDGLQTEILSGLTSADRLVSEGAIWVKLAQASGALDAHSGHVH